ncbi:MAG: hypothetical protein O7G84_00970 [Gammaproteobacteria bacterium]|nr:hypothetical protein [Gammaproteobacteria bacterium]
MTKKIGSPKSRRAISAATKRLLKLTKGMTHAEAADRLSLGINDVCNLRQGNSRLSVPMLLKMVRIGRYDPASVLVGPELKHMSADKSVRGAQQRLINARIARLARLRSGEETARLTGLSVTGAFGLRYRPDANVTLYTVMGFWHAGHDFDAMIFGG